MFARFNSWSGCILLCHVVFTFKAKYLLVSGASRHYNSYLLKGITLRRQRFAKGLAWKCQEIASGFLGDFSGTQGLTQGSARDNEGMPSVCQGIDQAVARALWLSPSGCSVANMFFYGSVSHPSYFHPRHTIRFAQVLSACLTLCLRGLIVLGDCPRIGKGVLCDYLGMPWFAKGVLRACHGIAGELPRDCPAIALRLPRDCLQDLQRNCLWPVDCLLIALGCKGVAEGLPRDILGIVSRLPSENCQGIAKGCRGPIYEKTMASENVGFGFFCLLGLLGTNGSML